MSNQLIKHYIKPGTILVTDEGNAFNDIKLLTNDKGESLDYDHRKVCHAGQYNSGGIWSRFKDWDSGVHNNVIEGVFGSFGMFRGVNKLMGRCSDEWSRSYSEWMIKRNFYPTSPVSRFWTLCTILLMNLRNGWTIKEPNLDSN